MNEMGSWDQEERVRQSKCIDNEIGICRDR